MKERDEKMKVLIVMTSPFEYNGITNVILNYYRALQKKDDIKIDLLIPNNPPLELENEIKKNGSLIHIVKTNIRTKKPFKYMKLLNKILKKHKYEIIHVNGSSNILAIELLTAKLSGVKTRIAHCHSTETEHPLLHKILAPLFFFSYNIGLACSKEAGEWLFKKRDFQVLSNAFNIEKFYYNESNRKKIREELGVGENEILLGHVGYFNEGKNQQFIIRVLNELNKIDDSYKLLLIGKGSLENKNKDLVEKLKLNKKVIFYGVAKQPEIMYSAMDIFLMPSTFEGLGIVAIEAQLSGLACILSTGIPKSVKINNKTTFLPITQNSINDWKEEIINSNKTNRKIDHKDFELYDIQKKSNDLYEIYINSSKQRKGK